MKRLLFLLLALVCFIAAFCQDSTNSHKLVMRGLLPRSPAQLEMIPTISHTTYDFVNTVPPLKATESRRTIAGNTLFGGLSGLAVGIGVTYPAGDDSYRPTFREIATGAVLGTAAGITVGFVTGIIKAAKRRRSNAF